MSSIAATLRECHRLRRHVRTLQEEVDRGPRVLRGRETTLAQHRQTHHDHHDAITKLKLKLREDEGTLKQTEARLDKLREQVNTAANQKEYDAKLSEIAQAQIKKGHLEDAILATMAELEGKTAEVPAVDRQWADVQAEFAEFRKEAEERLQRLKADQAMSREELAKVEVAIPATMRPKYDALVKAHGPDAFAAVKDRVCQGCRTTLTQQKCLELQAGGFFLCPSCGKMLYAAE